MQTLRLIQNNEFCKVHREKLKFSRIKIKIKMFGMNLTFIPGIKQTIMKKILSHLNKTNYNILPELPLI
jgi:Ca2+-dependent lipid-binding protein